ncbi:mitochondrial inner membrane protease subunit 1 [Cajanus cajan]|uniref:mitochondrial inner membrane protease subunit 1 n=2 Tax=Cajanus cajan TaxID=3821 RepID=UPI00098DA1BA|nr:mitochondrial inner membrane protease subunit 1 [Cajanus cajan]XP_020205773.1 mitochondrial inner membrane protease subunit 1 [Cajanus cajan]
MIFRNLGPFVPIIKVAWEKTIAVSKLFCFLHITSTYVICLGVTAGPSMLPTIELRPNLFLFEKISTRFGKVACGDIVGLRDPQDPRRYLTKRVVGLEGDSVTYISDPENNDKPETTVVPKGGVWLEGDNKYNSRDSRTFGPVPYGLIQGKMFWKILPLNDIGPFWDK